MPKNACAPAMSSQMMELCKVRGRFVGWQLDFFVQVATLHCSRLAADAVAV